MTGDAELAKLHTALKLLVGDVDSLTEEHRQTKDQAANAAAASASANRGLQNLTTTVRHLVEQQKRAADSDDVDRSLASARYWLAITDSEMAVVELADLIEWLGSVYLRFRAVELTDCWDRHECAVAELQSLWLAYREMVTGPKATAAQRMDWLSRYRPGTVHRVDLELSGCSLAEHTGNGKRAYRPPTVPGIDDFSAVATAWARDHGGTALPPPSADMLAQDKARRDAQRHAEY